MLSICRSLFKATTFWLLPDILFVLSLSNSLRSCACVCAFINVCLSAFRLYISFYLSVNLSNYISPPTRTHTKGTRTHTHAHTHTHTQTDTHTHSRRYILQTPGNVDENIVFALIILVVWILLLLLPGVLFSSLRAYATQK